jgi:cellulose biosynthesis protein BcsQ
LKILVVDQTAEGQSRVANHLKGFDPQDLESLDVNLSLAGKSEYLDRIGDAEVLILGSGLGANAQGMARHVKELRPKLQIIIIATDEEYAAGAFRATRLAGARKVLPESSSAYDLLQELVGIQGELRAAGSVRSGRVVVVTQAKGGVGATSICAALGELCSTRCKKTLLWDLDLESKDLSRGLTAQGPQDEVVESWVDGSRPISGESFRSAVIPMSEFVTLLRPPRNLAAAMDLVGHPDSVPIVQRILELAQFSYDNVIIDAAGRLSPATGVLMRLADQVLVVVDDSVLGLTAAHSFISDLLPILPTAEAVRVLCSGIRGQVTDVAVTLREYGLTLPSRAWELPAVPFDRAAECWPGAGKSLYSIGRRATRRVLEKTAVKLGLIPDAELPPALFAPSGRPQERPGIVRSMLHKVSSLS